MQPVAESEDLPVRTSERGSLMFLTNIDHAPHNSRFAVNADETSALPAK